MLPGNKRVRTRVKPVEMPTIEAWPTASKAPRPPGTSAFVTHGRHARPRQGHGEPAGCT